MSDQLADSRWLTSAEAAPLLRELQQRLTAAGQVDVRLAASLRKSHSATHTHLLLEQVELRSRARDKFADPSELFFTRKGLEQCTDEALANYKAERFPWQKPIADLCCGIGGDALALSKRGQLTAWDADPVTSHFAERNLQSHSTYESKVVAKPADGGAVSDAAAWHIDPDRRPSGERTIELHDYEPGPEFLHELLQANANGSVKIAPAAVVHQADWPPCEREWLGSRGECRQQVLWFGKLARQVGRHVASIVSDRGVTSFAAEPDVPLLPADEIRQFIYEPDATILAAHLAGAFAAEHELCAITVGGGYLTSDECVAHPLLASFRVRDVLPYDLRKLKTYCREHRLGQLEIKKRGIELQPHFVRRQIIAAGDQSAVIFITPFAGSVKAIVAERC
jgi:hypothetical protein